MNNFVRHSWFMFGAFIGIGLSLFGWPVALGWAIGYGLVMWLIYGFGCGYTRVVRHPASRPGGLS